MDFWKSQPRDEDEEQDRRREPEPNFFERLTDFVKDEALDSAIDTLSGGWLALDDFQDDDDEDERPRNSRNPDSFEERLQRELAKLTPQADAAPEAVDVPSVEPVPSAQEAPAQSDYVPAVRPFVRGPQGFGRKLV